MVNLENHPPFIFFLNKIMSFDIIWVWFLQAIIYFIHMAYMFIKHQSSVVFIHFVLPMHFVLYYFLFILTIYIHLKFWPTNYVMIIYLFSLNNCTRWNMSFVFTIKTKVNFTYLNHLWLSAFIKRMLAFLDYLRTYNVHRQGERFWVMSYWKF